MRHDGGRHDGSAGVTRQRTGVTVVGYFQCQVITVYSCHNTGKNIYSWECLN
jgi:hypothetical protein